MVGGMKTSLIKISWFRRPGLLWSLIYIVNRGSWPNLIWGSLLKAMDCVVQGNLINGWWVFVWGDNFESTLASTRHDMPYQVYHMITQEFDNTGEYSGTGYDHDLVVPHKDKTTWFRGLVVTTFFVSFGDEAMQFRGHRAMSPQARNYWEWTYIHTRYDIGSYTISSFLKFIILAKHLRRMEWFSEWFDCSLLWVFNLFEVFWNFVWFVECFLFSIRFNFWQLFCKLWEHF